MIHIYIGVENFLEGDKMYPSSYPYTSGRLTVKKVESLIAMNLQVNPQLIDFQRIDSVPSLWKHACMATGVTALRDSKFQFGDVTISYAVCRGCGRVKYHFEV